MFGELNDPAIYKPEFSDAIVPPNGTFPFYHTEQPSIIPGMSDKMLSVVSPLVAYWVLSLIFHALDVFGTDWVWLSRYRIRESEEVKTKNLVTKWDVVLAVIFQQVVQTILGVLFVDGEDSAVIDHASKMGRMSPILVQSTLLFYGDPRLAQARLEVWGATLLHFIYWWFIPALQLLFAFFLIDTWQYFLHRYFHTNKFLYRHFHSWHHRLYVPYAFGALYNHPIEGLLLDTVGAVLAQHVVGLSLRQATVLFTFATLKTVDDHCGYSLPFDPLQILFSNNADYHDIHHLTIGIKNNFAQPFFIHWDIILGTRMTRQEVEAKQRKAKANRMANGNGVHANGNGAAQDNQYKKKTE